MAIRYPVVPNQITVHLGAPTEAARDIVVPFTDYINNVASSELYPTWPENSLKANIYAIISFALNRIYNEWYPSKGYNFDITNSPAFDQTYIPDREIYENIANIVEDIFNDYVVKQNQIQPYFTRYCDGRKTTCDGLSQWGTVTLANQGKTPLEILRYYYGSDIQIRFDAPVGDNISGYPGYVNRLGSVGNPVRAIQRDLERIRINYPAIPKIEDNYSGVFNKETEDAVKKFQEIFALPVTGMVDKATWYKIKYVYTSVKKLSDLYSEGITPQEANFLYKDELKYGDTGIEMEYVHYYLDAISFVDPDIPHLKTNSVFNDNTKTMVMAFQKKYGLPVTGIITYADWKILQEVYNKLLKSFPSEYATYVNELYPDYFLTRGMSGDDVRRLQRFLLKICQYDKSIPGVRVNGIFDELTEKSIKKIQTDNNLDVTGLVGPFSWRKIVELSKRT
ncbi:MAG: peptidoglycan-binding protein [Bacilli bacterium]|nr:peptidoglycan-binding protein [Bacilli bacterium]